MKLDPFARQMLARRDLQLEQLVFCSMHITFTFMAREALIIEPKMTCKSLLNERRLPPLERLEQTRESVLTSA